MKYCAVLQSAEGSEEIEVLVDLISTNHTKFFREPDHFSFLTKQVCCRRCCHVWSSRVRRCGCGPRPAPPAKSRIR